MKILLWHILEQKELEKEEIDSIICSFNFFLRYDRKYYESNDILWDTLFSKIINHPNLPTSFSLNIWTDITTISDIIRQRVEPKTSV